MRIRSFKRVVLISGKPRRRSSPAPTSSSSPSSEPAADAERVSRIGQDLLNRLEKLRVPVVAAIHGACLGGGLEVALACRYRVARDHPKTMFALPEVQLGLIPGMGGTQRLPRRVGLQAALDMILTGRNVRAKRALQMGLVDEMVHPAILRDVALDRARALADGTLRPPRRRPRGATSLLLEHNPIGRSVVFKKARESVMEKTHGHYPGAARRARRRAGRLLARLQATGLREEARLFGEMAVTDVSRQLVFLFFASNALKKDPGVDEPAPPPREMHKLGVLGAGFMGAGIASIAVQQGTLVRLKDTDTARIGQGLAAVRGVLQERLTRKQITPHAARRLHEPRRRHDRLLRLRVGRSRDRSGVRGPRAQASRCSPRSSRRSIRPRSTRRTRARFRSRGSPKAARHPERVLGMHFFSPVHRMPLLEVIVTPRDVAGGDGHRGRVRQATRQDGDRRERRAGLLHDAHAVGVHERGRPACSTRARRSKRSTRRWSISAFRSGRSRCSTKSASTSAERSARCLSEAFGARMAPSEAMRRVVAAGRTGRKGGKGFYRYDDDGEKGRGRRDASTQLIGGERREIPTGRDRRSLRAGDGERGRAVPRGGNSALAARRRHRRGVRDRVSAIPRRTVPLHGQRRRRTGS